MDNTIYGLFEKAVAGHCDEPAIIENGRTLTFSELSEMVDKIANSLPDGIHSVGIVMNHRAEMVASMLAVLKMGALYVPAEPDFPKGRIDLMMKETEVDVIITEMQYREKLEDFPVMIVDCMICAEKDDKTDKKHRVKPEDLAYVLYTSGTTGRPKGVSVTNRNVCHYVRAFADEFHPYPGDVMLQYSVCSFDIFVEEVFATILNGAAIAIPSVKDRENINNLMNFVERHGVTMISGFPYLLKDMNYLPKIPFSLRLLISGGDVLRGSYVDNLVDRVEVYNTYGPSETTVCASYYRCSGGKVLNDGTYPIGHPVNGAEIKILNRNGRKVRKGRVGEICILGDGVSNGYIGDHDKENKAFEKMPDGRTMYHSGDLGYILPDGNIAFLYRKDSQVMIKGKRVEVMEVESRLCQCKDIEQAVVRSFVDEEGLPYMVAYVVSDNQELKASDIIKELSVDLTDFMIPEFIVKVEQIPLNVNGKPDMDKIPLVMKVG